MANKFVVGIRWFEAKPQKVLPQLAALNKAVSTALGAGAEHVLIAINGDRDVSPISQIVAPEKVTFIKVTPAGSFVPMLNAILMAGRQHFAQGCHMLISSTEMGYNETDVEVLFSYMDGHTACVGAALEGHDYHPGTTIKEANGVQIPWNTFSLLNPYAVCVTGIPMLGDGTFLDLSTAGVEELITYAVIQRLYNSQVKLVSIPSSNGWDTRNFTGERLEAHKKKMASKISRPAAQLQFANLKAPTVQHI